MNAFIKSKLCLILDREAYRTSPRRFTGPEFLLVTWFVRSNLKPKWKGISSENRYILQFREKLNINWNNIMNFKRPQ
ncbi:unnamed protein product [Blepharisma stoltei]|uniref:Uncharacterized protein n=1 Tax=Blepharisma stoltei TaxID=1481888 RepID=A0AAU9JJB9_9CILI|nr:unnamed protein product [Blepharisma stoltei]